MSQHSVLLLNDDDTPMEFVVDVLQRFFGMERQSAVEIMLRVHNVGASQCGSFDLDTAKAKVADVIEFARQNHHPLQCAMMKNK